MPEQHRALGAFLKSARERVSPESAGIRPARARRAKGLRREEVAVAAGISVTWYCWIEQGRVVSCSTDTLDRIAQALQMNRTERAHLFDLAGARGGRDAAAVISTEASEEIRILANSLAVPVYVVNGLWDVLYWNRRCAASLGAFDRSSRRTGNVLRRIFLDDSWRAGFVGWDAMAESAVAQFRAATGRFQRSDDFATLVSELADESDTFRSIWERRLLAPSPVATKVFEHPRRGRLEFRYASLKPDAAPEDVRLIVYTPA